jgi:hypothetical protein
MRKNLAIIDVRISLMSFSLSGNWRYSTEYQMTLPDMVTAVVAGAFLVVMITM